VVRRGRSIALVGTFLIGCAVLVLVADASRVQAEARCEGTRPLHRYMVFYANGHRSLKYGSEEEMKKAAKKAGQRVEDRGVDTSNDLPGCPKGGLLKGTDKKDDLNGMEGEDKVRGLGGSDYVKGGPGSDILYGGDGNDYLIDYLDHNAGERDKFYCGKGKDRYHADKNDYVDSSCEKTTLPRGRGFDLVITSATSSASASPFPGPPGTGGPAILLPAAVLLLGSGILTYAILRRR
jgi:hypothetical protein